MAHQLSGSASTFGYHKVAYIAREVESRVVAWRDALVPPAEREIDYLKKKLQEILELLPKLSTKAGTASADLAGDATVETSFAADAPTAVRRRLLFLHDNPEFAKAFARIAHKRELRVESFDTLAAVVKRIEARTGDLVILGGIHAGRGDYEAVRRLHDAEPNVPIFVLATDDSTASRVAAVRAGAKRFLHASQEPAAIVDACVDFLAASHAHGGRIMVLDDDRSVLELVAPTLTANGCEVFCLSDPTTLFERLRAVNPDVLLCDIDMPGINGVELTRALRASEQWSQLPILVMSRYSGFEQRAEAYQAGADDFLTKPVVADELVVRVTARLERETLKRNAMERDALTGLLNRKTFLARASLAIERCGSDGRDLALAVVELEHLTGFVQAHGLDAADAANQAVGERLQAAFGVTASVIGRLAGPFFAVLEYDTTVDELAARLEKSLAPLARDRRLAPDGRSPETVAVTAGVVACPADASLAHLIDRAAAAKRHRNRVAVYKLAHGAATGRTPIYIVDDDRMLCEMLSYSLSRAGFHCEVYHAGDEGLRALLDAPAHGTRPVVLLDIDLPHMDGMSVLREIEIERPGRYQVVLLTAHGGEAAQIEGLRSSAVDYLVKPINVPLVIEKVRKLAEDPLHA
jgi:diguanylate cyclase (GGDEF)-like protein